MSKTTCAASIERLDASVSEQVDSSSHVSSYYNCFAKLVTNSIRRGTSQVAIRIGIKQCSIEVRDNGKCYSLEELEGLGQLKESWKESSLIHHLVALSHKVTIISKQSHRRAYQLVFRGGSRVGCSSASFTFPNGNQIVVEGLFHNFPVRQMSLKYDEVIGTLKTFLNCVSVLHPNISFALEDMNGSMLQYIESSRSSAIALRKLFLSAINEKDFVTIEVSQNGFLITGEVASTLYSKHSAQLLYINGFPVLQSSVLSVLNQLFSSTLQHGLPSSSLHHACYYLNIACDPSEYSFVLDSVQSCAEFTRHSVLLESLVLVNKKLEESLAKQKRSDSKEEILSPFTGASQDMCHTPDVSVYTARSLSSTGRMRTGLAVRRPSSMGPLAIKGKHRQRPSPDTTDILGECTSTASIPNISGITTNQASARQLKSSPSFILCPRSSNLLPPPEQSAILNLPRNSFPEGSRAFRSIDLSRPQKRLSLPYSTEHGSPPLTMKKILCQWNNPVFTTHQEHLLKGRVSMTAQSTKSFHHLTQSIKFTREMFQSLQVIGQVDTKFIATVLFEPSDYNNQLVVLIDQHAAHERIRLEQFINDMSCHKFEKCDCKVCPCYLQVPLTLDICKRMEGPEERLQYKAFLSSKGFMVQLKTAQLTVQGLPKCLTEELNHMILPAQGLSDALLIIFTLNGKSSNVVPGSLMNIFKSLACHGAIKFGDELSNDDCAAILRDLSQCQLPFQCAHGRPSTVPLIQLKKCEE